MKDLLTRVGDNIRKERIKLGLSQEELASIADIHRTFLSGVERGERNISLNTLAKISAGMKVKMATLLKGADD